MLVLGAEIMPRLATNSSSPFTYHNTHDIAIYTAKTATRIAAVATTSATLPSVTTATATVISRRNIQTYVSPWSYQTPSSYSLPPTPTLPPHPPLPSYFFHGHYATRLPTDITSQCPVLAFHSQRGRHITLAHGHHYPPTA